MREIHVSKITKQVRDLFISANYVIGPDVLNALRQCQETEPSELGQMVLDQIIKNDCLAADEQMPICQDTGLAVLFVEYGQDVHVVGGNFEQAVEEGVRQAYTEGYLRKSVVSDPLFARTNSGDNTPAVIHVRIVPGENIRFLVTPKG
ncbi:MAG TPA: fumarate hydratase, partial [Firmicutes bacterium]|nr:fumarate hydratase [Bacillota bacterium]